MSPFLPSSPKEPYLFSFPPLFPVFCHSARIRGYSSYARDREKGPNILPFCTTSAFEIYIVSCRSLSTSFDERRFTFLQASSKMIPSEKEKVLPERATICDYFQRRVSQELVKSFCNAITTGYYFVHYA